MIEFAAQHSWVSAGATLSSPTVSINRQIVLEIPRRYQFHSLLLRLPPEIRNEIYTLVIGDECHDYRLGTWPWRSNGNLLALISVCKQLHAETRLLPFSIYAFSFHRSDDYAAFIAATSSTQRSAIRTLRFDLTCLENREGEERVTWTGVTEDDFSHSIDGPALVDLREACLRSTFSGLQKVFVSIACWYEHHVEFMERWAAGVEECNEGVVFDWHIQHA